MPENVISFPTRDLKVSKIRSRDKALQHLLPKILGVLWSRGVPGGFAGSVQAILRDDLELGALEIFPGVYCIHACVLTPTEIEQTPEWTKIFSAHLGSRAVVEDDWPYWEGRCSVVSWRRGVWEDRIMAEQVEPRTFAHLLHAGLARGKHQAGTSPGD